MAVVPCKVIRVLPLGVESTVLPVIIRTNDVEDFRLLLITVVLNFFLRLFAFSY
jgi:hypothetical protein